ncbi:hypothetical protein TNCV_36831 [Trichonephila clavipes]|nr:hypothetical protein TNCV_36831 [Trichonephila clavipes]
MLNCHNSVIPRIIINQNEFITISSGVRLNISVVKIYRFWNSGAGGAACKQKRVEVPGSEPGRCAFLDSPRLEKRVIPLEASVFHLRSYQRLIWEVSIESEKKIIS